MAALRTFIALELPAADRERIARAFEPLRMAPLPVRWLAPEALHITLHFLGAIDSARVESITAALRQAAARHAPFPLTFQGLGAYPSAERARVWWLGVTPEPRLHALQQDVHAALVSLGLPPADRPFAPHLTIGRARGGRGRAGSTAGVPEQGRQLPRLDPAWIRQISCTVTIPVAHLALMRSHTGPDGAHNDALARVALHARVNTEGEGKDDG